VALIDVSHQGAQLVNLRRDGLRRDEDFGDIVDLRVKVLVLPA
jgi:hypothetical protein